MIYFGIDISKLTFDVTALLDNKSSHKKFKNNSQGFFLFHKWIKSFKTENYICMEATGVYGAHLASFLVKKKYKTIVSNPYKIKNYAGFYPDFTDTSENVIIKHLNRGVYDKQKKVFQRI